MAVRKELKEMDPAKRNIVWGVREIARVLNLNERQAYHKLSQGLIPGARKQGTWSLDVDANREAYREADRVA